MNCAEIRLQYQGFLEHLTRLAGMICMLQEIRLDHKGFRR